MTEEDTAAGVLVFFAFATLLLVLLADDVTAFELVVFVLVAFVLLVLVLVVFAVELVVFVTVVFVLDVFATDVLLLELFVLVVEAGTLDDDVDAVPATLPLTQYASPTHKLSQAVSMYGFNAVNCAKVRPNF